MAQACLNHRERVLRAITHQDVDRVPLYYRAEPPLTEKLKARHGLKTQQDLLEFFDVDALQVGVVRNTRYISEPDAQGISTDIFGNKIQTVQYGEVSSAAVLQSVLAEKDDVAEIAKMRWPAKDFVDVPRSLHSARAARATGLAVYGGMWASLFTTSRSIMGEEHFLISTISHPDFVTRLVERLTDFYLAANEAYFSACSKYIDVFYFGSDFGTQASLFISPQMFRQFFKPSFKRLVDQAKGHGLKVMYHTCGAVCEIVPDLIDCGIDVLDPIQVSAARMKPALLAEKFKGRIAFHGGISTQTTLPFGTPEQVQAETLDAIRTLGPTGYVAAPDQELIGDIPLENIDMLFRTAREFRC